MFAVFGFAFCLNLEPGQMENHLGCVKRRPPLQCHMTVSLDQRCHTLTEDKEPNGASVRLGPTTLIEKKKKKKKSAGGLPPQR